MFLHAYRLRLTHPATGETLQFEAPLPADCRRFVNQLSEQRNQQPQSETDTHGSTAV
jgi:23S rRNA pseudouridine955/2504/2580 synthase